VNPKLFAAPPVSSRTPLLLLQANGDADQALEITSSS
jgi:hypothetical protein